MTPRLALFMALQRMAGSQAPRAYAGIRAMANWSTDRFQAWQQGQLRSLLDYAAREVPYFRERVPAGRSLRDFPVLRKEGLFAHHRELMDARLRAEHEGRCARARYSWVEITSGGTTGIPTTVIHEPWFRDQGRAARLYALDLAGFPFGTPHYRLWGSVQDIRRTRSTLSQRVLSALSNQILLNAFRMDDEQMEAHARALNRGRARHLIAFADAADHLARFARARGIAMRPLTSIMTTGGTLTEDTRRLLQETFGARVHNKYGSRDGGELACECAAGSLHIFGFHALLEAVDDCDRPVPAGETGRLLVTCLDSRSYPLIRFDIGDQGALSDGPCSCGCPFPVLRRLEGRAADFLTTTQGVRVTPLLIRHLVGVVHGQRLIRRFQLIQEDALHFDLALEPEAHASPEALRVLQEPLLRDLRQVLGADAGISLRLVDRLAESESGKFRYTVNRARPAS